MQEDKELHSDLDVEIVNLDDKTLDEKRVPRSSLHTRFSPRQRRVQAIVTISVVMLALLTLVASNSAVIRSKFVPTPAAAIPLGTDRFYVDAEPGWGHLFVDGKLIEHVPNTEDNSSPILLSRGTHTLQWDAVPFPRQTCTMSVPPKYHTDTCEYNALVENAKNSGWLFSFSSGLTKLPNEQRTPLVAAVQATLQQYTTSDIVQTGEVYVADPVNNQPTTAREPLRATLHYELDTKLSAQVFCSPSSLIVESTCRYSNQDCRDFCAAPNYFTVSHLVSHTWNVFVAAHAVWDYTTFTGKSVVHHYIESIVPGIAHDYVLPVQISWDGARLHARSTFSLLSANVSQGFTLPLCNDAQNQVDSDPSLRGIQQSTYVLTRWNYVASPNVASGCLGVVTLDQSQTTQPAHAPALCLYRFGVFRAANDVAHTYWPNMPLANASEQHLAQQLHEASMSTQTG